jgi:predicted nucleic acid-binding protein
VFAWSDTLELSDRFRLTLYDACYLELAQRRNLPLATLDGDLRAAGDALGIEMLGA